MVKEEEEETDVDRDEFRRESIETVASGCRTFKLMRVTVASIDTFPPCCHYRHCLDILLWQKLCYIHIRYRLVSIRRNAQATIVATLIRIQHTYTHFNRDNPDIHALEYCIYVKQIGHIRNREVWLISIEQSEMGSKD
jgi:hypothetical protein